VFVGVAGVVAAVWCAVFGSSVWSVADSQVDGGVAKKWVVWKVWTSALVAFSWVSFDAFPLQVAC
jgi:hypothetical protein